jgi:DNA-binding response OmpR family regulator
MDPPAAANAPGSRVLVVDDDRTVSEVVAGYLTRAGFRVDVANDATTALGRASVLDPDLVLLDLSLPDLDGIEVCQRLRRHRPGLPVIMLTARGDEDDRVLGLRTGADDYVTKPFSPRELVLRVQSVLRRASATNAPDPSAGRLVDGDLVVDLVAHGASRGGEPLTLTAREFDLLAFLVGSPGRAYTRVEILREVWGWEFGDQTTVTVHVRRLREKVERDPAHPVRLVTVWGVGYRWDADGS